MNPAACHVDCVPFVWLPMKFGTVQSGGGGGVPSVSAAVVVFGAHVPTAAAGFSVWLATRSF